MLCVQGMSYKPLCLILPLPGSSLLQEAAQMHPSQISMPLPLAPCVLPFTPLMELLTHATSAGFIQRCTQTHTVRTTPETVQTHVNELQALESARVQPGQRVLIHGGSGGVGSAAVQIAKAWGAHVTTTCSAKNIQLVKVMPETSLSPCNKYT